MTPAGEYPPLMRVEDVIDDMLVRCPALEWSVTTRGNIYYVLWKVHRPQYRWPGAVWQVALQLYNKAPYKWPKLVGIGHLEPATELFYPFRWPCEEVRRN